MTSFGAILQRMVERVPGAVGAVFTDWEGEPIDQFAHIPPLDIQLVGAHWGIVFLQASERLGRHGLGGVEELLIEGDKATVLVRSVTDKYFVVLATKQDAHLGTALRELSRGAEHLRSEM